MNIFNFQEHIDSTIIDRGYAYYQHGSIEEMEQIEQGVFRAIVAGSMDYDVAVTIDADNHLVSHHCDCPYDWGVYCKHIVAVLFHIKENNLHKQPIQSSAFHRMKEQLQDLDKTALIDLVVQLCRNKHATRLQVMEVLKEYK